MLNMNILEEWACNRAVRLRRLSRRPSIMQIRDAYRTIYALRETTSSFRALIAGNVLHVNLRGRYWHLAIWRSAQGVPFFFPFFWGGGGTFQCWWSEFWRIFWGKVQMNSKALFKKIYSMRNFVESFSSLFLKTGRDWSSKYSKYKQDLCLFHFFNCTEEETFGICKYNNIEK